MTAATNHEDAIKRATRRLRGLRQIHVKWAAGLAVVLGSAVLSAGCGGPHQPGQAGLGANNGVNRTVAGPSTSATAKAVAYARCMRGHGVADFPDPTPAPGGGFGFQINAGPGSDLNHDNPRFKAADSACRLVLPRGAESQPISDTKLAAEVKWAHCMRSHGLAGFPDPDPQGAFDSSRFDDTSSAFRAASQDCHSLEPSGPVAAVPGHGHAP